MACSEHKKAAKAAGLKLIRKGAIEKKAVLADNDAERAETPPMSAPSKPMRQTAPKASKVPGMAAVKKIVPGGDSPPPQQKTTAQKVMSAVLKNRGMTSTTSGGATPNANSVAGGPRTVNSNVAARARKLRPSPLNTNMGA